MSVRVRPVVQEDGGDIKFISFDEDTGLVLLQMRGSCSGCPSSSVTLKGGIEKMLTHYVAEVLLIFLNFLFYFFLFFLYLLQIGKIR